MITGEQSEQLLELIEAETDALTKWHAGKILGVKQEKAAYNALTAARGELIDFIDSITGGAE
ncbi:hypothetical protein PF628_gp04 [Klebsiella phage VLCpiS11a]|uniref:hypothetical protein n=1 Tax=Klebsiella phage VLCpiS11a TaxID=2874884 RepID=UPI0022DCDC85|nr:hypothetical protein PF628_gp04 [Klebsiella phage VLCpiS11a]UVX30660.1 hypothetical protein S11a_00004 [Klebsiella phage VLCpiS11a]